MAYMHKRIFIVPFLVLFFFIFSSFFTAFVYAEDPPVDPNDPCPTTFTPLSCPLISGAARCNTMLDPAGSGCFLNPCTTCHLLALAGHILTDLIALAVLLAVCLFIYAGWVLLTTAIAEKISIAKRIFWNTFFGLIVILAAWLIVDTILSVVASGGKRLNGATFDQTFCSASTNAEAIAMCEAAGFSNIVTTPPPRNSRTCEALPEGDCSVASLTPAFGDQAANASAICRQESNGRSIPSSTDRLFFNGGGAPFSMGLFQINMITTNLPPPCGGAGLNCPAAFGRDTACEGEIDAGNPARCAAFRAVNLEDECLAGGLNGRSFCSTVTNSALFAQCSTALRSPGCNVAAARQIFEAQGWAGGWTFSARQCGIP